MRFYSGMTKSCYSFRSLRFFSFLPFIALMAAVVLSTILPAAAQEGKNLFYVGTYTEEGSKSKGIYAFRFDGASGDVTPLGLAAETTNPSFVATSRDGTIPLCGE